MMMNTKVILGNMLLLCLLPVNIIFALCFWREAGFPFLFSLFFDSHFISLIYMCVVLFYDLLQCLFAFFVS